MINRSITLTRQTTTAPDGQGNIAYAEELVALFIDEFTQPGDLVFDPFAGFGTTLVVAERMGRRALGVELLPERVSYIRSRLVDPAAIIDGDALRLADLALPPIDFVMTSPPYMTVTGHPQNPLTAYQTLDSDYTQYIEAIAGIFRVLARVLKSGRHASINVANLRTGLGLTPLAYDIREAVSSVMRLEQTVRIEGTVQEASIVDNYCYVFANSGPA